MNTRDSRCQKPRPCLHSAKHFCFQVILIASLGYVGLTATAEVRQWTGSASANWSNPDNWNPVGAPQILDSLHFDGGGNRIMLNDISGLTVRELVFFGADFTLNGNSLSLSNTYSADITMEGEGGTVNINCSLVLATNCEFNVQPYTGGNFGRLRINADLNLNGHNLLLWSISPGDGGTSTIEMAGSVSGDGDVSALGINSGRIEFTGTANNTFTGKLVVKPGFNSPGPGVYLDKQNAAVVNNRLEIWDGATLYWRNSNQIGDNATVVIKDGSRMDLDGYDETLGTLILTNAASDTSASAVDTVGHDFGPPLGTLTVNQGIVSWADSGAVLPTITGRISLSASSDVFFISSPNYAGLDIQAEITGLGGFTKYGNAALLLKGTNTFGGTVYGLEGVIDVYHPEGFGSPAGGVELNGGSVTLRNLTIANETLTARGQLPVTAETIGSLLFSVGTCGWNGPIVSESNLVLGGSDVTLSGPISGTGGLGCFSLGTITLGGALANTYTGKTLVRCPRLVLNKGFGVNAFAGPLEVGGGFGGPCEVQWNYFYQTPNTPATLFANGVLNLNGQVENFGPIIFNGGAINTGSGFVIAENTITANPAATTAIINGNLSLSVNPSYLIVSNGTANPDLLITAAISGSDVRKQGPGTLTLTAANTHNGYTLVEDGILEAQHPSALGTTSGNTIVWSGATLRLGGIDGMAEGIQIEGPGFQGTNGALQVATAPGVTRNLYGGLWLNGPATINTLPLSSLAIHGSIGGTGPLTKTGIGILSFGGSTANTYSGGTLVSAGSLQLFKNANLIAAPGSLTIGSGDGTRATVYCFNNGMIPSGGTVTVNASSVLYLTDYNQTLAQLNLNDGGEVQADAGTLGFTAGGSINIGTLKPGLPGLQNSSSISGRIALPPLDYLTFNVSGYGQQPLSSEPELVVSAVISGGGNIVKNGFGAMRLSGANTFNDSPPYAAGDLIINAGTVIAASNGALGGTAGWTWVQGGGRLSLINNITISDETLYLNSTNSIGLDNPGGNNFWTGPVILARDSGISVNQAWSLFLYGAISGSSANDLTKVGMGALIFGGAPANTYSGETFINAGELHLAKPFVVTAVPGALSIGNAAGAIATVRNYQSYQVVGNIFINRNGTLHINGFEENVDHLYLADGGDVVTDAGYLILKTAGSLTVTPGNNNNPSTISGNVDIASGSFPFNINAAPNPTSQPDLDVAARISSSAPITLQKNGAGQLRFGSDNTYLGPTYLNEGTLWVDGQQPQSPVTLDHGTRLQGSGTVGDIILNGGLTTIAPGTSPGTLTCSNLVASGGNGTLQIELNGTTPGSGHDQINVRGSVDLLGLKLSASLGFASVPSSQFTIINNDSSDAVSGTFTGLAQNGKLYIGGELFRVNYSGATGNDVVLSRLVAPPPPVLMIEKITPGFVRLRWPTNDPAFRLIAGTNLATTNWTQVLPLPVTNGTNLVVTNAILGPQRFYRLINP